MKCIRTSLMERGRCPRWNVDISVCGHYEYQGGKGAVLTAYACPIVNNTMLPDERKDQQFKDYLFCDIVDSCSLVKSFPRTVEVVRAE